nr:zinc finger, CCHC-type [Tanacetum cinerariifolium]
DLAAIDTAISDKDQALLLLISLPSSYDNFMETLLYGRDTLKLEYVVATLYSRELQKMTEAKCDGGERKEATYSSVIYVRGAFKEGLSQRSAQQCTNSGVARHLDVARIQQHNRLVEDTTMSKYQVNRSPSSAIGFKKPVDMLAFFDWLACIKQWMLEPVNVKNKSFNESGEYKKTFIGSSVGTSLVHVLQRVKFEVEPQEDHTFEVEPHGNVDHVVVSHDVQTQDLVYYHLTLAVMDKIYAHESLTLYNTIACEVISKWKYGLKDDIDARSDVLRSGLPMGLLDKAKGNVLGMKIVKDLSENTLRVSQSRFYNRKLVQTFLEGHFILSLESSLSWNYDVEKNGKWSCIYVVGSQEYLMVYMRLDIASEDMAGYVTLTEAAKEAIWLMGLVIESRFELKIVAGIATCALSKDIPGPRFQHRIDEILLIMIMKLTNAGMKTQVDVKRIEIAWPFTDTFSKLSCLAASVPRLSMKNAGCFVSASNILLDGDLNPKISDFGMAKLFGINESEANTSRVVGTRGYMSPEYMMEGVVSTKTDVFSFGDLRGNCGTKGEVWISWIQY